MSLAAFRTVHGILKARILKWFAIPFSISEVKWALGSITTNKASGGDGISVELFQILKDDVVKVLHSVWKRSVFIPVPKKGSAKECSYYCTVAHISHDSKVMLKSFPNQASTVCEL